MSELPTDWHGQLDLRAEIARIDHDLADITKLRGETEKFVIEQRKLTEEAIKFRREPWLLVLAALIAAWAALIARLPELLHAAGLP
jgi:hypothetical protein